MDEYGFHYLCIEDKTALLLFTQTVNPKYIIFKCIKSLYFCDIDLSIQADIIEI